ncbi:LysM peptidoglycan-binding domain-containing protein [Deinococcus ruber]|uniref:LysM peptidoglycan-binding domain-containing protein n=1 Tax=Deinococcus ruber TaxID=1848197 RepID=A0A918CII4_9DEIO|nr:LysM peptidoglycan-binding domain-containing protein [Deinococcus ruber]GGR25743.1 hypothetical protein GCM10008957_41740 [Deinococcus ruber]
MTSRNRFAALGLLATVALQAFSSVSNAATYTVQAGDTLYRIATSHGTDSQSLITLNHLRSSTVNVGQRLQLPAAPAAPRSAAAKTQPVKAARTVKSMPLPPGLPTVQGGGVRGPIAWTVPPAATVASFIGWVPTVNTAAFGNAVPIRTFLKGLSFDFQTYNNCGPSALASVLGFYKVQISQDAIRKTTRQGNGYMQVSAIAPELAQFGLKTVTIRGGQLSQIKRMLALGIPVIVLQWFDRPGHIDHFRVVRGYDDQAGIVWVSDSMIGPVAYLRYTDFEALWNTQGRQMFPVYPASYQSQIRALM